MFAPELLDIASAGDGAGVVKFTPVVVAPIKKIPHGASAGGAGVRVANVGGEKLNEALAGVRAGLR